MREVGVTAGESHGTYLYISPVLFFFPLRPLLETIAVD